MERRSVIWRGLHLPRSSWVGLDEVPGLRGEHDDDENEGRHMCLERARLGGMRGG